jgi:hypothetical protein
MNTVGPEKPVMRSRGERGGSITECAVLSGDAPCRREVCLVKRHQLVETAQVTLCQVGRLMADDVVGRRGDDDRNDSCATGLDGQLPQVLLVAQQRHAVGLVRPPRGHVHPEPQPGLHDAAGPEPMEESPTVRDLRIGQPVCHPVVVPPEVDGHDPRMERQHVAPELLKSLLRRPSADADLDRSPQRRAGGLQLFERLCRIAAELGARVSHEDNRWRFASSGGQGRLIVTGHPQQVRIGLIDLADRLRIGPAEFQSRDEVEMESANPQRRFSDRERHQDSGQCLPELRPPGQGGLSGGHQNNV